MVSIPLYHEIRLAQSGDAEHEKTRQSGIFRLALGKPLNDGKNLFYCPVAVDAVIYLLKLQRKVQHNLFKNSKTQSSPCFVLTIIILWCAP